MTVRLAARVGDRWEDIETPALVVDLNALEANLRKMADFSRETGVRVRPHAKTHKCPAIARKQIELGAVGICCQKVSEAEAMADGGVSDILVTNQIVGARKLERLAALSLRIRVAVCADNAENILAIDAAARSFNTTLPVLVEIDVGSGRCGVKPGAEALELASLISSSANLRFAGLQAYHGRAQHIRGFDARTQAIRGACESVAMTVDLLKQNGLECEIIGGAGTGTYGLEAASGLYNELQVGSYVFMDRDYSLNLDTAGEHFSEFRHSLFIKTTVMSTPEPDRAVTDAGLKAYTTDAGLPGVYGVDGAEVLQAADEHTNIRFAKADQRPKLGDELRLVPGHCDPTVNLHDWIIGVRDGRVECIWPVAARGEVT